MAGSDFYQDNIIHDENEENQCINRRTSDAIILLKKI